MKIAIGSDHAGFDAKSQIIKYLEQKGHKVEDKGTYSTESCDYPEFAIKVADYVIKEENSKGILICGTGIGMCITANKVNGIRAALCFNKEMARLSREHNDSNILCLGKNYSIEEYKDMIDVWLATNFEDGRHSRRLAKISKYEKGRE